jgi:hypothetical protein
MFLDAREAYFLKDANLVNEGSILSAPAAASSGGDAMAETLAEPDQNPETLAVKSMKPDKNPLQDLYYLVFRI